MSTNPTNAVRLGAMRIINPKAWERRIRRAMLNHKGRILYAARELGISYRLMFRILAEPCFRDVIHAPSGPPLAADREAS